MRKILDTTKPIRGGQVGTIKGGSKLKLFVKKMNNQYHCSIVTDGGTSSSCVIPVPIKYAGNTMTIGGTMEYAKDAYIIKVAKGYGSIQSHQALKGNEFGIRLLAEKQKQAEQVATPNH